MIRLFQKKREEKAQKPCPHQSQSSDAQHVVSDVEQREVVSAEPSSEKHTNEMSSKEQTPAIVTEKNCTECKKERHDRRIYRWKIIGGLLIPYFLSSLDLTIVASSSSFVASYFGKTNQLNWIATAYTLTNTAFIPTFGQLADIFGRHSALQLALVLMLIGSVLCAAAQNWPMLLLGRAIQGCGSAGSMNMIKIVLADKVSLQDNSKNTTIFAMLGGIAYSIGPVLGGYLTDASWRYCFVLPIPLAVIGSVVLFFLLRKELVHGPGSMASIVRNPPAFFNSCVSIDIGGMFLFIFGTGLIILATSWGGATYSWHDKAVIAPLVIGGVLFFSFFVWEFLLEPGRPLNKMFPRQVALIPWALFRRADTFLLTFVNFATGTALYTIFYYMSVYFSLVEGFRPSVAGTRLLLYLPGIGAGAYIAMFLCNVWPRQTIFPLLLGSVIEALGIGLLTWAVKMRNLPVVLGIMALTGAGTGIRMMPGTLHGVGIWPKKIASVLSLMDFALPFGGTIGLSIVASVFNNKAPLAVTKRAAQVGDSSVGSTSGANKAIHLPPELKDQTADAVMWGFIAILPIMVLCVIAATFLGNVWIKKRADGSSTVIYSSYIVALLTGTVRSKQQSNQDPSEAEQDSVQPTK